MESAITIFIMVSVMVLSVYLAYYLRDTETKHQKLNDAFTFCLPFIATMVVGMALVSELFCLLIVFTAALLAGTMSLLVSWTSEQKAKESKQAAETKNYTLVILIQRHSPTFRSAAQIS